MRIVCSLGVAALLLTSVPARADEPITLRMAAIAPDGTGWARELKAMARDVENSTQGAVKMKWYLGGIAGDEMTAVDRIRRGQLDGAAGALYCASLAPTLGMMRIAGLAQSREEAEVLLNHFRKRFDEEFKKNGFVGLVVGDFGNDVMLLRRRIDSFEQLKHTPIWIWNADTLLRKQMAAMGLELVPASIDDLSPLYDAGKIDGMFVIPTAALAFQWTSRAKYFIDLKSSMLPGCVVLSQRAYDQLGFADQQAVQAAANRFAIRFEELGRREDALLLDSMFEKIGVKRLTGAALRSAFLQAAARARGLVDDKAMPRPLLDEALGVVAKFRAEHHGK